jgi:hypothetical protein
VFYTIVVLLKRCSCVIRRINENALDLTSELLFERFKGKEIVTKDKTVIEKVVVSHSMWGVVGLLRVFQQNARLQLGPVLFANPGEFEFLLAGHGVSLCGVTLPVLEIPLNPPLIKGEMRTWPLIKEEVKSLPSVKGERDLSLL